MPAPRGCRSLRKAGVRGGAGKLGAGEGLCAHACPCVYVCVYTRVRALPPLDGPWAQGALTALFHVVSLAPGPVPCAQNALSDYLLTK